MDLSLFTGIIGSIILVTGAAWPEGDNSVHPTKSTKNWLFAIGSLVMLVYPILGYLAGGTVFFLILQLLVGVSTILMMADTPDKIDTIVLSIAGTILIGWSLWLFEGYNTIFFIIGLCGIALGYAFDMGSVRRSVALTLGSAMIALFSYIESSWVFFGLNVFFAIFSAYYIYVDIQKEQTQHSK